MMMTKKVIALILGLGLYACGTKDEPTTNTPKTETPTSPAKTPNAPVLKDNPPAPGTNNPTPNPTPTERPSDYHLGGRCQAEWTVTTDKLYTDFDLEALWLDNKTADFTLSYLRPYLRLYSSSPDGKMYQFVEEDYKNTEVKSIQYNRNKEVIELQLAYKGIASEVLRLPFDLEAFYDRRVTLSTTFASERYAVGFGKHPDLYQGDVLNYNKDRYAVTILKESGISVGNSAKTVTFTVRVSLKSSDEVLVRLQKELNGFRSLENLKTDMYIASSAELLNYFRSRVQQGATDVDVTARFRDSVNMWIKFAQLGIRQSLLKNTGDYNWQPEAITYELADLYFDNMRFELKSAKLEGSNLKLRVALVFVNEVGISDVEYDLTIVSVRN